jgi:hypothetical protein
VAPVNSIRGIGIRQLVLAIGAQESGQKNRKTSQG